MKLPITAIVLIAVIVMVLVVFVTFFYSSAGAKMNEAEAEKVFAQQCLDLCKQAKDKGYAFLIGLSESHPQFISACQTKYGTGAPNECLGFCGTGCNIVASPQQELCEKSRAMVGDFNENCNRLAALTKYTSVGASCDKC
ncbi:MAG: hypothetical protein HY831_01955 [Candidatus Aenigmarchaeota archaeon]|nr:hypothetical protein [Candidatus Aenigmarchaeota archaeon]